MYQVFNLFHILKSLSHSRRILKNHYFFPLNTLMALCTSMTFFFLSKLWAQGGAWIHDPEIKSHMFHWLSQPGTLTFFFNGGRSGEEFGKDCATIKNVIMREAFVLHIRGSSLLSLGTLSFPLISSNQC